MYLGAAQGTEGRGRHLWPIQSCFSLWLRPPPHTVLITHQEKEVMAKSQNPPVMLSESSEFNILIPHP